MRGARRGVLANNTLKATSRSGHFHRPDPQPYPLYKYTRRTHLEDVNSILYSDFAPEFHMHLHSIQIANSRQGIALLLAFFAVVIFPCWLVTRWLHKLAGSSLFPALRPGPDHAHMAPRLLQHLSANNHENKVDVFGRKPATFYRNFCRQEARKPDFVRNLADHGFKF
jgi:hypothetical protein